MEKKPPNVGFCVRVKARREELGLDRQEVADRSGLKYSTIADIENQNSYSSRRIDELARALDTTPEFLRDGIKSGAAVSERTLSERERILIGAYRLLTEPARREIDGYIKGLQKRRPGKMRGSELVSNVAAQTARKQRSG